MTNDEFDAFTGREYHERRAAVGSILKPQLLIETSNKVLRAAENAKSTAAQLRALAELIDTTIPGIDAIVNPPIEVTPATESKSETA